MRISDWSSDVCSSDLCIGRRRKKRHFAALHSLPALEIIGPVRQGGRTINEEPMALRVGVERQPRARSCYQADSKQRISQHGRANASHDLTARSEEDTSELQSLMRNSFAVLCLTKQTQ